MPGFRLVACLGEAAQAGAGGEGGGAGVGGAAGGGAKGAARPTPQPVEHGVTGQTEDEVDAILVAPLHDLRAAVMTVAADGDARRRPVLPYAADQPAQVTADLDARGRLAGAQQHGDRTACRGL